MINGTKRMRWLAPLAAVCLGTLAFRPADSLENDAAAVFKKSCALTGCHAGANPAMGLALVPENLPSGLLDKPSRQRSEFKLIDSRDAEKSYLLMKVRGAADIDGSRMPLGSPPLVKDELETLSDWVASLQGPPDSRGPAGVGSLSDERENRGPEAPAFWGTRLMNLPTPRSIGRRHLLFRVSHRFYPSVKEGYDVFYGFNGPASVLLSLGYGISDDLDVSVGHSNRFHEWIVSGKWRFLEEDQSLPLSGAMNLGASLVTESREGVSTFSSENVKFSAQLTLAYRLSNTVSLLLSPGYASNVNHWEENSEGTLAMGLGSRIHLGKDISILMEIIPVLAGANEERPGVGLGLEKKIGGHVFQVFALNSVGLTEPQYLPGGEICPREGDFRFGFNIFRWF